MMLPALLEKALALAQEGFADVPPLEALREEARLLEGRLASAQECVTAYEVARDRFALDGTEIHRRCWWAEQQCLIAARRDVQIITQRLGYILELVEREWAYATHRKAAHKQEVRA